MRLETVEHALFAWREWRASVEAARSRLSYEPQASAVERLAWWQVNNVSAVRKECRDALTRLRLPKSFARYWLAYFLSDYRHGSYANPEKIRLPNGLEPIRLPIEILDVERWREQRRDRTTLPILVQLVPRTRSVQFVTSGPNTPHEGWEALAKIEAPPWAMSDEVISLARQQLIALREWQEGLRLHPMYQCLRWAAAQAKPHDPQVHPPAWPQ